MPKVTGAGKANALLAKLAGQEKVALVGKALFAGGEKIKAAADLSITSGSSAGQSGGKHQHIRSLPGQPPNEEFGDLRKGIIISQVAPLRVLIESTAPHAVPLEFGTSKMAARPYMGPAARAKKDEVVAIVRKAIDVAIRS